VLQCTWPAGLMCCSTAAATRFATVRCTLESILRKAWHFEGDVFERHMANCVVACGISPLTSELTFRNPASYIKDGHTATLNTPHFFIFFQQIHVLNYLNVLHTLHFFLFKMSFIS
jgi:hypothetical protein